KFGLDAYHDPISCIAIGDMGGDVFGNGMLLNPALQLIAAFNHQHIFLDPNPDAAKSFNERQRLFTKVAGWGEYNTAIISAGGGVFERSAKSITLSANVQTALAVDAHTLSGEALIQAMLCAPVDLLYNGGIGTYVKASNESTAEVCDPANNSVRIDANELRCKVVCEGGNLGFTQQSRLEFASNGGIINSDAMDNSAGVDMSDHEVNLKILLASMPGKSLPAKQRNHLLNKLTDAVTEQCLQDNLLQSRVLTLAELDAIAYPPRLQRLRDHLSRSGWLDPAVAPNMDDNTLLHLRPQLSILLGQEKNRIHAQLSEESFHCSSAFSQQLLEAYFPIALHQKYGRHFSLHPLASEIIHTEAANHVVNHLGLVAVHHLQSMLDHSLSDIVEALLIAQTVLDSQALQHAMWSTEHDIDISVYLQRSLQEQIMLFAEALLRLCVVGSLDKQWINQQQRGLSRFLKTISDPGMAALAGNNHAELLDSIAQSSLNKDHALHMAAMPQLARSACAVHLSAQLNIPLQRCLLASQICLKILPIEMMEAPLRSSDWGGEDAHNLRREWLHRLTLLQSRAIAQLLQQRGNDFEGMAIRLWHQHQHWPAIEAYCKAYQSPTTGENRRNESKHLRLLLALAQLESVVDQN
ncbi:MAG: NAD-glutamate dehydrogenase, partial [Mariprofundus sp.]|nr:NAD-glutamate dehydrogenase [Mariprofundus sp.]